MKLYNIRFDSLEMTARGYLGDDPAKLVPWANRLSLFHLVVIFQAVFSMSLYFLSLLCHFSDFFYFLLFPFISCFM